MKSIRRRKKMARYLLLWELDKSKVPLDPKERAMGWAQLINMVKKDMKKGQMTDWGSFPAEHSGYVVVETATEVELMQVTEQYDPYVFFKVHPVASVSQVEELLASMSK
jgi:hypothetical protein